MVASNSLLVVEEKTYPVSVIALPPKVIPQAVPPAPRVKDPLFRVARTPRCRYLTVGAVVCVVWLVTAAVLAYVFTVPHDPGHAQDDQRKVLIDKPEMTGGLAASRPEVNNAARGQRSSTVSVITDKPPTDSAPVSAKPQPERNTTVTQHRSSLAGPTLPPSDTVSRPRDCADIRATGGAPSDGVYRVWPRGSEPRDVYCDMRTRGGGWTVMQRRSGPKVSFQRTYAEYVSGFGDPQSDHWLGLLPAHNMTHQAGGARHYMLYVELHDSRGRFYAIYDGFSVGHPPTPRHPVFTLQLGAWCRGMAKDDRLAAYDGGRFEVTGGGGWWARPAHGGGAGCDLNAAYGAIHWGSHGRPDAPVTATNLMYRPGRCSDIPLA